MSNWCAAKAILTPRCQFTKKPNSLLFLNKNASERKEKFSQLNVISNISRKQNVDSVVSGIIGFDKLPVMW